jgi:hypothetical protein
MFAIAPVRVWTPSFSYADAYYVPFRIAVRIDPDDTFGAGYGLAPPKPNGMHWRTYDRLVAELQRSASGSLHPRWRARLGLDEPSL